MLIETRRAADLLGATKMDRPEDVEANPKTGKVYVMLTNNTRRKAEQVDAANPRADNRFGHIIEMAPPDGDHAATRVRLGDPGALRRPVGRRGRRDLQSRRPRKNGWFGMPDNCAVDGQGRLWIATDGNSPSKTGRADGLWALETEGDGARHRRSCSSAARPAPRCAGRCFTPDDETLFVAVQHPGEADDEDPKAAPATFENPATRWPDFKPDMPPRPSVVAITRRGGGKIGT